MPGVGARTIRALAQVAEVVHGATYRFSDPARFSVAHGGKAAVKPACNHIAGARHDGPA